jgi:hypothetical protein
MRSAYLAAVAATFLCGPAQAEEPSGNPPGGPAQEQMAVGAGIICNTSEQVQHYVKLREHGAESTGAVEAINDEAHDARACALAVIAFMPEEKVEDTSAQGKVMSIVRITIVATFNGANWSAVPGLVQYTLMQTGGYAI